MAGEIIFTGVENAFLGNLAGRNNTLGSFNTFVGFRSGLFNVDGTRITLIGHEAYAQAVPSITNATAIGASAFVMTNDAMILGDLQVNVGLGLSGNLTGPQNKLEINDNVTGGSGLRFRQLTAADPATFIPNGRVLTVDGSGDVVLTTDIGGTGAVSACVTAVPTDENFITKWDIINTSGVRQICRTNGIYEDPSGINSVGIGVGSSPDLTVQLHMKGDLLIERVAGNTNGNIYMQNGAGKQRVFVQYGNFGYHSLAIGADAGPAVLSTSPADKCVYIGRLSGRNTVGNFMNTFVGDQSGFSLGSAGNGNTFVGAESAFTISSGDDNTLLGYHAGVLFQRGDRNTFVGAKAASFGMNTGSDNILIGNLSYVTDPTGNQNIIIGVKAIGIDLIAPGLLTNAGTIGYAGMVECSNCFTIAAQNPFGPQQQVGIGFRSPTTTPILTPPLIGGPPKLFVNNFGGTAPLTSAFFNGDIYTTGSYIPSDAILKQNIQPYNNSLQIIDQLETVSYEYNQSLFPNLALQPGNQVGFLAQQVGTILPHLVRGFSLPAEYDTSGNVIHSQTDFSGINYVGIIPYLVNAIKLQQAQLDSIELILSQCCASPFVNPQNNRASIELSNHESIILNQNSPNPFKEKTEITYVIPEEVKSAAILFYDQTGKILNRFEISHKGAGSLTVYGDDLSGGIYTYTLLIDDNPVKTKRMVKE